MKRTSLPRSTTPMKRTRKKLYRCQTCGHVDHDEQDGTGHWEQGGSQSHADKPGWSFWTLMCSKCGATGDMPEAKVQKEIKFKARKPIRKNNPETAKVDRKIAPVRQAFEREFAGCMCCGRDWVDCTEMDVHEMLPGNHRRHRSKLYRECWLMLCRDCHDVVQNWPLARQLRMKAESDPMWFDLEKIREVNGGGRLVEMEDIRKAEETSIYRGPITQVTF